VATAAPSYACEVDGVRKSFGAVAAVDDVTLRIERGSLTCLIGPNGAGKSTLLSLLACALAPSEGTVEWLDGARAGWVPQRPAQYGRLTPRENLELFARLEDAADAPGVAKNLLGAFELPDDGRLASALSVGNRQRLNVAIALIGEPEALLLDEPTASLDPRQRRRVWETTSAVREHGGGVVFATQYLDEAERFADRLLALRDGECVFEGTVEEYERQNVEVFG
jgi:ABC-2 type transport system ATP-binding protein